MTLEPETELPLRRGSDGLFAVTLRDQSGAALDLTAHTVTPFEADPDLSLTVAVTNAVEGVVTCDIPWNDAYPTGRLMNFRLALTAGGRTTTTNLIWVVIA